MSPLTPKDVNVITSAAAAPDANGAADGAKGGGAPPPQCKPEDGDVDDQESNGDVGFDDDCDDDVDPVLSGMADVVHSLAPLTPEASDARLSMLLSPLTPVPSAAAAAAAASVSGAAGGSFTNGGGVTGGADECAESLHSSDGSLRAKLAGILSREAMVVVDADTSVEVDVVDDHPGGGADDEAKRRRNDGEGGEGGGGGAAGGARNSLTGRLTEKLADLYELRAITEDDDSVDDDDEDRNDRDYNHKNCDDSSGGDKSSIEPMDNNDSESESDDEEPVFRSRRESSSPRHSFDFETTDSLGSALDLVCSLDQTLSGRHSAPHHSNTDDPMASPSPLRSHFLAPLDIQNADDPADYGATNDPDADLETQLIHLKLALANARAKIDEQDLLLRHARTDEKRMHEQSREARECRERNAELHADLAVARRQTKYGQAELNALKADNETLASDNAKLAVQVRELQLACERQRTALQHSVSEASESASKRTDLMQMLASNVVQSETSRTKLTAAGRELQDSQKLAAELSADKTRLESELRQTTSIRDALRSSLHEALNERDDLTREVRGLHRNNVDLSRRLDAAEFRAERAEGGKGPGLGTGLSLLWRNSVECFARTTTTFGADAYGGSGKGSEGGSGWSKNQTPSAPTKATSRRSDGRAGRTSGGDGDGKRDGCKDGEGGAGRGDSCKHRSRRTRQRPPQRRNTERTMATASGDADDDVSGADMNEEDVGGRAEDVGRVREKVVLTMEWGREMSDLGAGEDHDEHDRPVDGSRGNDKSNSEEGGVWANIPLKSEDR